MNTLREAAQQALEVIECFEVLSDREERVLGRLCDKLRAALAEPQEPVASPTAGMNMAQRILHVGGRNNAAGYVEFGSIQAVEALVRQVIRDLPATAPQPRKRLTDEEILDCIPDDDTPMGLGEAFLKFAREIEAAVWGDGK
jgi:hypothetical protein